MRELLESFQILPPWNDDVKFENFITSFFNDLDKTNSYDRFGRSGQKQSGIDVYSYEKKTVIQCKLKHINGNTEKIRKELLLELENDFKDFNDYRELNNLDFNRFIFASTFHSDTHISTECMRKSTDKIKVEYWSWERIKQSISEPLFKIYYNEFISILNDYYSNTDPLTLSSIDFIQDSNTLYYILKEEKPTKNQLKYVLDLINNDDAHRRKFYSVLNNPNWFRILNDNLVFHPKENPAPIQRDDGYIVPFWFPLEYLDKMAFKISQGENLELIDPILAIISNVSQLPKDNYHTWRYFINILSKLPSRKIKKEIVLLIPRWFESKFDLGFQSMELIDNLLPSILSNNPTKKEIEKFEILLRFVLTIRTDESVEIDDIENRFKSKIDLHHLNSLSDNSLLLGRIANYIGDNIILEIAENLRSIKYGSLVLIKDEIILDPNIKYQLESAISNENLTIKLISLNNTFEKSICIKNFEILSIDDTKNEYFKLILKSGASSSEVKHILDNQLHLLFFRLFNGNDFVIDHQSLSQKLAEGYYEDSVVEILSKILIKVIDLKIKNAQNTSVLEELLHNPKYRIPFFKTIVLHLISENWDYTKRIFLDFISKKSNYSIFNNIYLEKELYELFLKNGHNFRVDEISSLKRIIKAGRQNKERFDSQEILAFWKLKWLSSLRNVEFFKKEYLTLSKKLNKTYEYFENFDILRPADKPSISSHDFALMKISEIEKYLKNLEINETENNYMISRIYEQFAKEIEQNPGRYSEEISDFQEIPTKYLYHIAYGFTDAWKNKREFNWEKVLKFFENVLSSNVEEKSAHSNRFKSSVADLLSEGTTSDDNAFDLSLMPFARNIILHLCKETHEIHDLDKHNFDYPTYTLNSTNGKLVKVLILYSLRKARNGFEVDKKNKLEPEIESIFIKLLEEDVIDLYIQAGWYFKQLNYLNIDLVVNIISSLSSKETFIGPFLGGYQMINPSNSLEIYEQMHPIYKIAISTGLKIKSSNRVNYIRHIGVYYLWGIENLNDGSLTSYIIENRNIHALKKLITFFWQLKNYEENLTEEELEIFRNKIMDFWKLVDNKFENPTIGEDSEVLGSLFLLARFIPKLDIIPAELITKSIKFNNEDFLSYGLIEDLVLLMGRGVPEVTAIYIGKILMSMNHQKHFATKHQNGIINLVEFLYGNDQKEVANQYCNNMKRNGHEFLMSIFTSNN
jgi:hypothetical protein